ncbi:undecaprenyl-diphosphate phosphatase (plasmid) [Streptomyces sp. HUAS TT11]|uniref:undecaprenyl-diphosphate phosphatase n=1 Tax=Streptomyces sp. HUAS TT11 TaxID=3447508 RepID=UPI003F65EBEE
MTWFHATALGLLQGLTEFLPVSSSAHLRVFSALAGWRDPGSAFTAVTQLGTESAALIYFRRDIALIVKAWTVSLFVREGRKDPDARLGWFVIVGTVPLALIPGVSRSGGTISAGLLMGYGREAAARYSFLLAIPAVLASGGLEVLKIGEGTAPDWGPTLWATFIAFVSGYTVIAWFMKFISRHSFAPFVTYRVALGLALLALVTFGLLDPGAGPTG